jgi:hypothetical protein
MKPAEKIVLDEKVEAFAYTFKGLMNNPIIKESFDVGSVALKDKLEILSHVANGLIIDLRTAAYWKSQENPNLR